MDNENEENSTIPSKKKSALIIRVLKRIIIFLLILLVLLGGTGFIIGYYYQNEVKSYIVSQLNKQLNTEIIVDGKDIDFTVIKNFPFASLDFKNVKALDAIENKDKDTLFKAGKISLLFNIVDVFHKNYHIKKIVLNDVDLKIRIDKNGNDNYHFWKPSSDTGTTAFSFTLEEIVWSKIQLDYKNYKTKQYISVFIKKSKMDGNFSNEKYSLKIVGDLLTNTIKIDNVSYLGNKNIHTELALNIDNTIKSYKIEEGKIKIENLLFIVVGNVINSDKESIVNFGIQGKDMDIKSVLSLIPNQYKGKINDYESTGEFYFNAIVQGSVSKNKIPYVQADFGIKNADITQIKNDIVLHHVNIKGHYSNGNKENAETSVLELNPFSATLNQDSISGGLSLHNLNNPSIAGDIKANISWEELQRFVKMDTIETISGRIKIDASFTGNKKEFNSANYENITTTGNLEIINTNVKIKNNPLNFSNINGEFKFDNNDLEVHKLTGSVSSSDFELKGFFRNMMGFILKKNQDITVEATLHSKEINLNELLANKGEGSKPESKYKLEFSEHINIDLNSEIQHLVFRKFEAANIKGIIKLKDKKMMVDPITLSTMNGNITTSGLIDGSDSTKLLVNCFSEVDKLNVTKMFSEFENFGQTSITDQNIKGLVTAKIQFTSALNPELVMDMDKLYAGIDMTIENGELNNVESMKSLSRFIELKELSNIRFATLKNQFEIKNQVVSFPKMEIKSNAINIIASGSHTFSNDINYKVQLSLNELLFKKAKKVKKENDEFGKIADDGLGRTNIFLSMTGTLDKPIIKYDTKGAIQNLKQDLKVEKQTIKAILKEEFSRSKRDSILNSKAKKDDTKFIIKWDETNKKEEKKELEKPKKDEDEDF